MTSRWPWTIVLLLLAVSLAPAQEQDSASHIRLTGQSDQARPSADLAKQLMNQVSGRPQANGRDPEKVKEMADNLLKNIREYKPRLDNPDQRKKFLEENPDLKRLLSDIDTNDPTYQQRLQNWKQGAPDPAWPNRGERLPDIVKNLQRDSKQQGQREVDSLPVRNRNGSGAGQGPITPENQQSIRSSDSSKNGTRPTVRSPELPKTPSVDFAERARQEQRERDFLKAMERWAPKSMGKSPAMQRLVDDLANKDFSKSAASRFWKEGNMPDVNWNRVGRNMQRTGNFLDRNFSGMGKPNLPDAPHMSGPDLPQGPQMAGLGGAPSGGDILELGKAGSIIVTVLALLVGGFLLWRFLLKPLSQVRVKPADERLGEWPVNPWLIRTREELVKAFDYLTLLKCGLPAKMWHHHEVAEHLGDEPQREHASNLANVYEKARYSPPPEKIPEPAMDRARQDLCLLAGAAAP